MKQTKQPKIDFAVGGQAVIEGVMMRSPNSVTIAVRKMDGTISVKKDKYRTLIQRYGWLNVPILRGVIGLFEMMAIGTKAINYSANESLEEPEKEPKKKPKTATKLTRVIEVVSFFFSLVIALGLSLFMFKFIPLWLTTILDANVPTINENFLLFNIVDACIKATIFLTYIYGLSLIPSFKRVFEYHGAEHKAIFAYEQNLPLTVENAAKQTRFHPRCGTSFIIIVFILGIIFYTLVPKQTTFLANFALRATALPLLAGISYEALKFSAKYTENPIMKLFIAPGLAFQRLTTKEPKPDQLEVSLASLKAALEMEKSATT